MLFNDHVGAIDEGKYWKQKHAELRSVELMRLGIKHFASHECALETSSVD